MGKFTKLVQINRIMVFLILGATELFSSVSSIQNRLKLISVKPSLPGLRKAINMELKLGTIQNTINCRIGSDSINATKAASL